MVKTNKRKMKFKGTIIITDPCYITSSHDDWHKCSYGDNMEVFGINHYITENTLYGDWSCTVYEIENPKKTVDDLAVIASHYNKRCEELGGWRNITEEQDEALCGECNSMQDALNLEPTEIGSFCADAGLVSVFLLDEVRAYNPNIDTWIDEHSWCVTVVKDFDGDVEYYVDEAGDAHIIGVGSTNFFTTQTGL